MNEKQLLKRMRDFDPDLWALVNEHNDRQVTMLSLIPTDSAASPFSSYLKGSSLGNDFIGFSSVEKHGRIESMAAKRACYLFGAEHAIVRTGNLIAASRVVLQAFLNKGDTVLSFNRRKSEHCTGDQMQYNFVNFAVEPDTFRLNVNKLRLLALRHRPKMIIYSPVNYPHNIDYKKLRAIADEVKAILWIDLGQNVGLVATREIPSPVPFADVATFAGSDALHGPQSGVILSKKKFAELLERTVINTGHASLKKNVLAALAMAFREAAGEEYKNFSRQVLKNARALENGLKDSGAKLFCSPTENHLVIVQLKDFQSSQLVAERLAQGRLLVKAEALMTADEKITHPILRLSSLDPTTRALFEDDMYTVGLALGEFLKSPQDARSIKALSLVIKEMVEALPIFSDEWLPASEISRETDSELVLQAMIYGTV